MIRKLYALLLLLPAITFGQELDLGLLENLAIRNVGPANMSGRITAIAVAASDPKIIVVGAASGGVWKSTNGGSAWTPIFDDQPTQNIGAIAIQRDNPEVIWVGTGEGNPRNSVNLGMGLFKSEDGGKSWKHLGLEATKSIHRILIDPSNSDTVYIGAHGDPFTPNAHRGLFKTSDGGMHFERILFTNETSGVADMLMHPQNPNRIYVALYDHRRTPYSFVSGGPGSGLFVTDDKGSNWIKLGPESGLPEGELGRIGIALAPSSPNRMYAKVEAKKNALYRSEDGGGSWQLINDNPKFTNNRPFYFQDLAVDSKDPDRLYNIYQPLSVSYDGGVSFDETPMIPADETKGIHADFHAMWIDENDPKHFIIGGDGGLGITYDHGVSWYFPETIPVAQFYQIAVDHERPFNVYGGMQDNGNWSGPAYTWKRGGIRTLYWQYLVGGDGFYIAPDLENPRFGYGTSQNGDLYRYDKLTGYYQSIQPPSPDLNTKLRFNWNAAFAKDPFNADALYYGSQHVHKSEDRGASWTIISPDLSTNNLEQQKRDYGGLTLDLSGAENYNSLLAIAPSRLDKQLIWVATDDGQLHLTRDGGKQWKNLTSNLKGLPEGAWIARIHPSAHEASTAWAVVNNYRKGDYAPYLFKTTNYGKTWKNVLANKAVRGYALSFIQDQVVADLQFLGTEHGLYISRDGGSHWVAFKNGFPSVSTRDLVIQEPESALVVGTFGRAIWVLDDLQSLRTIAKGGLEQPIAALPMNEVVQVKGLFINPPGNIWTGFHTTFEGENRSFQRAEIPVFISGSVTEADSISVRIKDASGRAIQNVVTKGLKPGLNYVHWKLDEQMHRLPGAWVSDESRGIAVLAGDYIAESTFKGSTVSTSISVIDDPRFAIDPSIEAALYQYQKRLDSLVHDFSDAYNGLITLQVAAKKQAAESQNASLQDELAELLLAGRDRPVDRQVGAWQSDKITPHSLLSDLLKLSRARTMPLSDQEYERLDRAREEVVKYIEKVTEFKRRHKSSLEAPAR
jgi:photosystem II stability/assembly factor-like uncharacterized protein